MAEPLARSEAVRVLEDGVTLLRHAPADTVVYHWVGSVPFALAILLAWNSVTNPRTTDAGWAAGSCALALLLIWMNCWRSVYAGKLRRQLSGAPDQSWTAKRVLQLIGTQAFFGATKLLVLPLALLVIFPWAKTVAIYRIVAVLANREGLAPRQVVKESRRLAGVQPAQNWIILALLALLQAVLTVNLALVLALLPQLVRVLTGYESAYSRSGIYFAINPLFLFLVLTVSWIAFDPYAQAVCCVCCFEAESQETGEDLRCGLRRIRAAAPILAGIALLVAAVAPARAEVSPAELEKSVHQAMQAPEYDWRLPPASAAANTPWIIQALDGPVSAIRRLMDSAGQLLVRLLRWLRQQLFPSRANGPPGTPPGASLDWTVIALIALVAAAGALFAWQRQRAGRKRVRAAPPASAGAVALDAPELSPDALPEDQWLALADRCLAEQNFKSALRALYLASLAWLGRQEFLSIHAGKTNHEYENELNRRARGFPRARTLFAGNVAAFERAWYGLHAVSPEETLQFRQSMDELKATLTRAEGVAP